MRPKNAPSKFFEMIRSYVAFADTLNLVEASKQLNLTRQTIHRHIKDLQELKGEIFFDRVGNKFVLTSEGKKAWTEAKSLLVHSSQWLQGGYSVDTEFSKKIFADDDEYLFIQEHPLIDVWHISPPLIQEGLKCWVEANGQLEHRLMKKIRPYLILFREHQNRWLCIEVGDKSSIASWLGWKWAKSAIGTFLDTSEIVSKNGRQMTDGYQNAAASGGVCYEHICARLPRHSSDKLHPVNYQRLTFSFLLPNYEKVLASLVVRTNNIAIDGVDLSIIPKMPEEYLMEFSII
ncbi:MAG: helix-turn-helix domain-containing protein [Rhizobiaceae bacterium]